MNKNKMTCFTLILLAIVLTGSAWATVPQTMEVQGVLINKSSGSPVIVATQITFSVYDAPVGGTPLVSNISTTVYPDINGFFSLAVPRANLKFNVPYYLEISVNGDPMGRQPINSVPYALYAGTADVANKLPGVTVDHGNVGIGSAEPSAPLVAERPLINPWDTLAEFNNTGTNIPYARLVLNGVRMRAVT